MDKADAMLIQRAKDGDKLAFAELVKKYEKKIFNYAFRLTGDYNGANSLAQEIFLKAYRRLPEFSGEAAFITWLYRIVADTDAAELCGRRREQQNAVCPDRLSAVGDGGAILRQIRTQQAIDQLAADYRNVIILRDLQGLPYQQIAAILSCSTDTVKSLLSQGRLKLIE